MSTRHVHVHPPTPGADTLAPVLDKTARLLTLHIAELKRIQDQQQALVETLRGFADLVRGATTGGGKL